MRAYLVAALRQRLSTSRARDTVSVSIESEARPRGWSPAGGAPRSGGPILALVVFGEENCGGHAEHRREALAPSRVGRPSAEFDLAERRRLDPCCDPGSKLGPPAALPFAAKPQRATNPPTLSSLHGPCSTALMATRKRSTSAWPILAGVGGGLIPVYPVEFAEQAPAWLRPLGLPWLADPKGLLVAPAYGPTTRVYDAIADGAALLFAATRVDPDRRDDLLTFAREWGLLGAATPPATDDGLVALSVVADSVAATREVLRAVQRLAEWLAAMQAPRWRDPVIMGAMPVTLSVPERRREAWRRFAEHLNVALEPVVLRLSLSVAGDPWFPADAESDSPALPVLRALTVRHALFLQLWLQARHPGTRLRICPTCRGAFPTAKTNREKRYCSRDCQSKAANAKWYGKKQNRARRNARRRDAASPAPHGGRPLRREAL
jgi:hypothetical protein